MSGMRHSTVDIIANQLERQTNSAFDKKPLIEYCTNDWRNLPEYRETQKGSTADNDEGILDDIDDICERCWEVVKGPKFRRLLLATAASIFTIFMIWTTYLGLVVKEETAVWTSMNGSNKPKTGVWGKNMRARLWGLKQIDVLDQQFMPLPSKRPKFGKSDARRLIFVGDIHGSMDELEQLLKKAKYNPEHDHIVTTGDMIDKGPKSLEVIDYLLQQNASCVRGNHEDRVLDLAKGVHASTIRMKDSADKNIQQKGGGRISATNIRERNLAITLRQDQIQYLDACPLMLYVGETKQHGDIVVAHAGLVPMIELDDQDPLTIMNMRVLNLNTHVPSRDHERDGCVPWADLWNSYQRQAGAQETLKLRKQKDDPGFKHMTVVYGHDARRGLQIKSWTKGLDAGCVTGGKLTAWVLSSGGKEEIVQVKCKNYMSKLSALDEADDY